MDRQICTVCKTYAELKCSACQNVFYCSKKHQKEDWRKHKVNCRAYKVVTNQELGRYLVSTRSLVPGELVLYEQPLISGPPQVSPPLCLGCCRLLNEINSQECSKCGWPVCCLECEKSSEHKLECDLTCKIRGSKVSIQHFGLTHPSYECITVLRCLLCKEANPQIWEKISQLQSHFEEREESGKNERDRRSIAQFIRKFFKYDKFTEEEILRVAGIVQVNAHEVPLSETGFVSLYDVASFLKHDCQANCSKSFTSDGSMTIRAAVQIPIGQALSICYTDALWGTINRRHHLFETKFFSCYCKRCCDPTELHTNFSSLKCNSSGCDGNIVYGPRLTDVGKEDLNNLFWICHKCGKTMASHEVDSLLEKVGRSLSEMQKNDIHECKQFLKTFEKILHPNHYHLTDVKIALVDLIGQMKDGLSDITDIDLEVKINYAKALIDLTKTLVPAEVRVRGILAFELHAGLAEMCRRKTNNGEYNVETTRKCLLESRQVLTESILLLSSEPEDLPEGMIAIQGRKNLRDIDTWLQSLDAMLVADPL